MLAKLYHVLHDDTSAERVYKQVMMLDPNDEEALNGLAMISADKGDIPAAIKLLKQAVEKNPDARTILMLGEFYEQVMDYSNAADAMKMALSLVNDNVRIQRQLAVDLLAAGRIDEALSTFQDLANGDPKNAQLQLQIAEILEKKHDYAGAETALNKARAIKDSPELRFAQEELLRAQGKFPQAIAALQSLLLNETKKDDYTKDEKDMRRRMLEALGGMNEEQGKIPEAVAAYRQISDLDKSVAPLVEAKIIEVYRCRRIIRWRGRKLIQR